MAVLFALTFVAQVSPLEAQEQHCDIPVFDENRRTSHFACRPVPHYFYENLRAGDRLTRERGTEGGIQSVDGEWPPVTQEELARYGYRCPDALGKCRIKWIPDDRDIKVDEKGNNYYDEVSARTRDSGQFVASWNINPDYPYVYPNIKRVSGAGIGVQSILDQNPVDAVNVWGEAAQDGGWVCFDGVGRLIYLDSRTTPNAQKPLDAVDAADTPEIESCGLMPGPGTVVFLPPEGSTGSGSAAKGAVLADNANVRIESKTKEATYFTPISGAQIGDQSILDQNPIDAVDVWGPGSGGGGGGEACFKGEGRLLYVDTSTTPRTKTYLSTYKKGDRTCGKFTGSGQVIFLPL